MRQGKLAAISCGLAIVGCTAARADAIDGHWCFTDGARISIQGAQIVTPAGSHLQGDYTRHFFSYVVPTSDPGAGQTASLTLLNEDTMRRSLGTAAIRSYDGAGELWHRCGPPTS